VTSETIILAIYIEQMS